MIKQSLFEFKETFDRKLEEYFDGKIKEAETSKEISVPMLNILKEFTVRGGKRIRPALVYHSYLCFSDKNLDEAIKAGIACELVQSFLLIHDDIMDSDDFRRSKPTVHKIYEAYFNDPKLGESLGILCGDLAISLANEMLLSIDLPADRKIEAGKLLNDVLNKVGFGQELDVVSSREKEITEEELFRIHKLKTSKYTFEGPLLIGAILAGAKRHELDLLKAYATPMGLAFQLQDDMLGLFGNEERLGKPIGSDIREGKKTLLILKAKENCNDTDKAIIDSILGRRDITKHDVDKVRQIVQKTGSLDYSKDMTKKLLDEAKKEISILKGNPEGKNFLLELIDYLSERDY